MESGIISILGLIALIVLVLRQKDEITKLRDGLTQTFDQLSTIKKLLEDLKKDNSSITASTQQITKDKSAQGTDIPKILPPELPVAEPTSRVFVQESLSPTGMTKPKEEIPQANETTTPIPPVLQSENITHHEPTLTWFERFKQNNPDIEKFIGENLINKIGIIILVLGISFFVKYAIDKDWINEPARVGIGILCGGILLAVAHRLRLQYQAFSSVLVAGAIAIFYFTIAIAFHDYGLFNQTTAFIIMILITVFSVFVSVIYNRQELAVLSVIGGFAVPFMVSTGAGNYVVLFTYLAVLNVGMLSISYFKRWFLVSFVAFLLTTSIVAGWYLNLDTLAVDVERNALIYSAIFYIIFSVAFVLNNLINKTKFNNYEIAALISNTAAFYGIGYHVVSTIQPNYVGLFTILTGAYNIIFAIVIYKKYQFDKNIIYVLIGLALTLATITIPVQFSGNYITIFWACEAVLLFWLSSKSQLKGFTFAGIIVQALALISLLIDLADYVENKVSYYLGTNMVFATGVIVIVSLVATYRLFKTYDYKNNVAGVLLDPISYRRFVFYFALFLAYILPMIEVAYQADAFFANAGTVYFFMYLHHMLYTTILAFYSTNRDLKNVKWIKLISIFNMLFYIILAYRVPLIEKEEVLLYAGAASFPFAMYLHYITLFCLIYQAWLFVTHSSTDEKLNFFQNKYIPWFIAFFIVHLLSTEINILFLFNTFDHETYFSAKKAVIKVVFPILWGSLSFAFLIYGIKRNMKQARIIALTLLGITILKLFIYDIRDASETGKIIAFILLGVLILVISFVYQKIKNLIVDRHENTSE